MKLNKNLFVILLILLVVLNIFVYLPSLDHISRGDQNQYLTNTVYKTTFWSLVDSGVSYDRSRLSPPGGDSLFFKPLFFVFLGIQKWIFNYNFFYWQLVSLILHCVLIVTLYCLLWQIYPGFFAFGTTALFSVLHVSQEMVIWHHMSPALLFLIFILNGLRYFLKLLKSRLQDVKSLYWILFWLFFACLLHEFGVVFNGVIVGALLWYRQKMNYISQPMSSYLISKKKIMILTFPMLFYFLWNILDYFSYKGFSFETVEGIHPLLFLIVCFKFWLFSLITPFIPAFLDFQIGEASMMSRFSLIRLLHFEGSIKYWNGALLILLGLVWMTFFRNQGQVKLKKVWSDNLKIKRIKIRNFFCYVILLFEIVVIFIIGAGRLVPHGFGHIYGSLYYFYYSILFQTIFLFCFISQLLKSRFNNYLLQKGVGAAIILAIILNAICTYRFNLLVKEWGQQQSSRSEEFSYKLYHSLYSIERLL